jgi:hypothetical protein
MSEHSPAQIAETPDKKVCTAACTAAYTVLYDGQCEICQACVAWLKTLDRENKTICLPISAEALPVVVPAQDRRMPATVARRHSCRRNPCWLGRRRLSGAAVPDYLAHWRIGTAVPLATCRAVALRVRCYEPIFAQQVSWWCLPHSEARSGTTASPTRRVLVMLHAGILHTIAACPVGRHQGCGAKDQCFRPDVPQAA